MEYSRRNAYILEHLQKGECKMAVYGYHRTSTRDQHLDRGIQEIRQFCKEHEMELKKYLYGSADRKEFQQAQIHCSGGRCSAVRRYFNYYGIGPVGQE